MTTATAGGKPSHARLSPSGAHRWMKCHAAPRLAGEARALGYTSESSPAAIEGTAAHAVAAECLRTGLIAVPTSAIGKTVGTFCSDEPDAKARALIVTRDMAANIEIYLRHVWSLVGRENSLRVEVRLSLADVHPDMFGTADAVVYDAKARELHVFDLKFGRGVIVDAANNPQLLDYALGAIKGCAEKPKRVFLHIIQPRAGDEAIKTFEIDRLGLFDFEADIRAAGAKCDDPKAVCNPGPWCKWCEGAPICEALGNEARAKVTAGFSDIRKVETMSPAMLGKSLLSARDAMAMCKAWLEAVEEFADIEAKAGRMPDGFKAVVGRGARDWMAHDKPQMFAAMLAKRAGRLTEEFLTPSEVISPAQAEKLLGKADFGNLAEMVIKKTGSPQIVPLSDKREAVSLSVSATDGFTVVTVG